MPKVVSTQLIELRPGVTDEAFERFVREEVYPMPQIPGWNEYLVKGNRGERNGKYMWFIEIESVETRDRYFPDDAPPTKEAEEIMLGAHAAMRAKWQTLATLPGECVYTDYVKVTALPDKEV